jgi:hypothetical protein
MQGNSAHDQLEYPLEEYRYWQFAERYGWTPSVVDQQSVYFLDWILAIGNLKNEIEREQNENQS